MPSVVLTGDKKVCTKIASKPLIYLPPFRPARKKVCTKGAHLETNERHKVWPTAWRLVGQTFFVLQRLMDVGPPLAWGVARKKKATSSPCLRHQQTSRCMVATAVLSLAH